MSDSSLEKGFIISALDKGQQRKSTKFLAQEAEVFFAKNTDFDFRLGGISKALGYDNLGNAINSGATILGCGTLNTSDGTERILAFSGTDAYKYNSGTGAWDAQSRSYTASQNYFTANILETLIKVSGITDAPESYNGSAWSTTTNITDMPKAKYIIQDRSRIYLFYINIAIGGTFPSRCWYCDLPKNNSITWGFESGSDLAQSAGSPVVTSSGSLFKTRNIKIGDDFIIATGSNAGRYTVKSIDSETQITLTDNLVNAQTSKDFWVGGNWFDVDRDNSDVGMGLGVNSGRILLFKRFSLHAFQKTTNNLSDTLLPVPGAPGTTSQRSVVNIGESTYYFSDTGIWQFNGARSVLISTSQQEYIDGMSNATKTSVVAWKEGEKVLKMFIGDVNNTDTGLIVNRCVLCHDTFSGAWWVESYADTIKASTPWLNSNDMRQYLFSSAGQAFKTQEGLSHDGDPIEMVIETWPIYAISPEVAVDYSRFKIYGESLQMIQVYIKFYADEEGVNDEDWRDVEVNYQNKFEMEIVPNAKDNHYAGFALRVVHYSATNRPVIERIVGYYMENSYSVR